MPDELGNLTYLETLYLKHNTITGNFPLGFANLDNLNVLVVDENSLTGEILTELKNFFMRTWGSLGLDDNDLCTDDEELRNHIYGIEGHHIMLPVCTEVQECTEDTWECNDWSECSSSGIQTRTCEITNDCVVVETESPNVTQSCTPPSSPGDTSSDISSCTADIWTCTDWGSCSLNGIKTRTCEMTVNCSLVNTPSPDTSLSCTPTSDDDSAVDEPIVGECSEDTWDCGEWSACSDGGQKTRSCLKINDCEAIESTPPLTIEQCTAGDSNDSNTIQNITIINIIIDKLKIDIKQYVEDAEQIMNNVFIALERNENKEGEVSIKYTEKITKNNTSLKLKFKNIITNFITYGTPTTLNLGEGERAGVVNSYQDAFGELPEDADDWEDVVKIANGRWPGKFNKEKEEKMKKDFKRIYLREPEENNQNDEAALTVMSYGLRPSDRNLNSERVAIKTFKNIYNCKPTSASDWDIVRAIAYSGAVR